MTNKIIALIWPSWAGKTTTWKGISRIINREYLDWDDDLIEKRLNKTVTDVLFTLWDKAFLELENKLTLEYDFSKPTVYSTSWSIVLNDEAMIFLKKIWTIIYLKPIKENISDERILNIKLDRIVWMPKNIMELNDSEKIRLYKEIMQERTEKYEEYADLTYARPDKIIYKRKHNWVEQLSDYWRKIPDIKENINFNNNEFHNFLKKQWIVQI